VREALGDHGIAQIGQAAEASTGTCTGV
jgi:hypothetical protein